MSAQEEATGSSRLERGVQRYVEQTVEMWRGGFDARRMLLQQALARDAENEELGRWGRAGSPGSAMLRVMQQNTRLIVLTLEVGRM